LINARFGTFRGLVRLGLSYGQVALGQASVAAGDEREVKRLVFVCHGNICRSAFADVVARRAGLNVASLGLSTSADQPAHGPAIEAAARRGFDMTAHRTTRAEDFVPQSGDLLLGMEVRHMVKLKNLPGYEQTPRTLLGMWARPLMPHLHDPYKLDPMYMDVCLARIEQAVGALANSFPGARLS
jgi:protein-tyrosine phosphatase